MEELPSHIVHFGRWCSLLQFLVHCLHFKWLREPRLARGRKFPTQVPRALSYLYNNVAPISLHGLAMLLYGLREPSIK